MYLLQFPCCQHTNGSLLTGALKSGQRGKGRGSRSGIHSRGQLKSGRGADIEDTSGGDKARARARVRARARAKVTSSGVGGITDGRAGVGRNIMGINMVTMVKLQIGVV